jgi:peptidoglycan glycosyltransferase
VNSPIRRLSVVIAALFSALLIATTLVQFVQAKELDAMAANKRTLLDNYSRERGSILVGGQPIAKSVPVDDQYEWLRTYPSGQLYSHITGFYAYGVGNPYGLEHASDALLSGDSDALFVRRLTDLITGRASSGATLELTINPKAQQAAEKALGRNLGAVVALDPKTGAILAMVSHPNYDPNALSSHDLKKAAAAWKALSTDPQKAYYNRAIGGNLYPPGSTFKVVTAAAALENGIAQDENSMVPGPAVLDLPLTDATLPNENRRACGPNDRTTLIHALEISCNTAFGSLGLELGGERLRAQAAKFGFGDALQIPLRVSPSSVPADLNAPQAAQSAIGQYEVRTTPLQMAMVAAGIANQGSVMKPYLVQSVRSADLEVIETATPEELSRAVEPRTAEILTKMMVSVVENGSGGRAKIDGVSVAGKTGTAQHDLEKPPHAWFISFAPANDPKIAVAVVVEDGGVKGSEVGGGRIAAPIAKAVMEAVVGQ